MRLSRGSVRQSAAIPSIGHGGGGKECTALFLRIMSPTSNRPTAATLILSARSVHVGMLFDFRRFIKTHHTPLECANVPSLPDLPIPRLPPDFPTLPLVLSCHESYLE